VAGRSKSKVTTDHDEIRRWVEERGGRPAVVKTTRGKGDDVGILRIDFTGFSGEGTLEPISSEEFFGARKTTARGKSEKGGARSTGGAKKAATRKRAAGAGRSSPGRQRSTARKTARKSSGGKSPGRTAVKRGRSSR
jgi:hypothetical protein